MIARIWHGWTTHANAAAYEALLRNTVLPGITRVAGYAGAHLLRQEHEHETEFVTITWFENEEAVRAFAGPDDSVAVVPPAARALLSRFDERSAHYSLVLTPDESRSPSGTNP